MVDDPFAAPVGEPAGGQRYASPEQPVPPRKPRLSVRAMVILLAGLGLVVLAGPVLGKVLATKVPGVSGPPGGPAASFLDDLRLHRFSAAYRQLCPSEHAKVSLSTFTSEAKSAVAHHHGVRGWYVGPANIASAMFGDDTSPPGSAGVTYGDGTTLGLVFIVQESADPACLSGGYEPLLKTPVKR